MNYQKTSRASLVLADALGTAMNVLTQAGFRIVARTPMSLEVEDTRSPLLRPNAEALGWANAVQIDIRGGVLSLQAQFDAWPRIWQESLLLTAVIVLGGAAAATIMEMITGLAIFFTMMPILACGLACMYLALCFRWWLCRVRCVRALDTLLARMAGPEPSA